MQKQSEFIKRVKAHPEFETVWKPWLDASVPLLGRIVRKLQMIEVGKNVRLRNAHSWYGVVKRIDFATELVESGTAVVEKATFPDYGPSEIPDGEWMIPVRFLEIHPFGFKVENPNAPGQFIDFVEPEHAGEL